MIMEARMTLIKVEKSATCDISENYLSTVGQRICWSIRPSAGMQGNRRDSDQKGREAEDVKVLVEG